MLGGISFDKVLVIAAIAVMLIGPQRLPMYAEKLGGFVRNLRKYADGARDRMRDEVGADVFDEIDWKKLDPRQYDPRRIIRDALSVDEIMAEVGDVVNGTPHEEPQVVGIASVATRAAARLEAGALPPFDPEAT
ncbi:MAG: twin-arginine translocase TatA/TatE family subunit [Microbacteriaceae bacterium]|nr:twin-arginine translocase TatA/TatE family subunit [Microbacteriaceae bacterium]MCL2794106.1 twin-arginine translocase TatA/TatE family subunit [Microbacteriaceae bacterium]